MNSFLTKVATLVMFLLAVICGWSALYMVFSITLWNFLLGILAAFFLFRALELTDRINHYGPHADPEDNELGSSSPTQGPRQDEETRYESGPDEEGDVR